MPPSLRPRSLPIARVACAVTLLTSTSVGTAAAQRQRAPTGVVTGQVVESGTHKVLPGVTVRVSGTDQAAVTDVHGEFRLRRVPVGTQVAVIGRLGYQASVEEWDVQTDTLQALVSLKADTLKLKGITVMVDRLERRVRASGMAARTFRLEDLNGSTDRSAAAFVANRMGLTHVSCNVNDARGPVKSDAMTLSASGFNECFWVRGGPQRICVVIDEAPSMAGLAELDTYRPQDIYRVDVFGGGRFVSAYTKWFMAASARRPWVPMPIETAMMAYCQ